MELFYHKATTTPVNVAGEDLSSKVFITGITQGLGEVVITFNVKVAFENGETMTLRAYGAGNIYLNTGVILQVGKTSIEAKPLTKEVRADSAGGSSQTITLNNTHGISGGNTISYIGLGVDNSSSNNVNVVTPDCPDLTSSGALDLSLIHI